MTKLTDTQLIILGKACERPDGAVYPIITKLKGGAVTKVLSSLIGKGLLKEVRANRDETIWRRDDEDHSLTLHVTPAAYQALGIEQDATAIDTAAAEKPRRTRVVKGANATNEKPTRTRADSKQAQLIEMLKAPKGVTIDEIVAAFGWQPHTVRGAIAGALRKKFRLEVTSEKVEGRGRVYRIR